MSLPGIIERHMSRKIIEVFPSGGTREHPLSIAELTLDSNGAVISASIFPFQGELPFTTYHDHPLQLTHTPAGQLHFSIKYQ